VNVHSLRIAVFSPSRSIPVRSLFSFWARELSLVQYGYRSQSSFLRGSNPKWCMEQYCHLPLGLHHTHCSVHSLKLNRWIGHVKLIELSFWKLLNRLILWNRSSSKWYLRIRSIPQRKQQCTITKINCWMSLKKIIAMTWGSHAGDYEDGRLLGCSGVFTG
jgi:hypothetical protein